MSGPGDAEGERQTGPFQPKFNLVLLTDDDIQARVSLCKPAQRLVICEGRADEHNVIKLVTEGAAELVHEELRLARVGRPHDESIEQDVGWFHFNSAQIVTVSSVC